MYKKNSGIKRVRKITLYLSDSIIVYAPNPLHLDALFPRINVDLKPREAIFEEHLV